MSNDKQIQKRLELPHRETLVGINTIQTNPFDNQKTTTMSNNKQSMKLYTEEQVREAIIDAYWCCSKLEAECVFDKLTPIELPSDKEIDVHVEDDFINAIEIHKYSEEAQLLMKAMCKAGALWMRDKLQGGNNEQQ